MNQPNRRHRLELLQLEPRDLPATLVTPGLPAGTPPDGPSERVLAVSDDGTKVLFTSKANNLAQGATDSNGSADLFWRDLSADVTRLVTRTPINTALGYDDSDPANAVLSADGKFVAFVSTQPSAFFTGENSSARSVV